MVSVNTNTSSFFSYTYHICYHIYHVSIIHIIFPSYREFMESEEIQNPPTVKTEMENMIKEQIVLSEQRLRVLQHIGYGKRGYSIKENNSFWS